MPLYAVMLCSLLMLGLWLVLSRLFHPTFSAPLSRVGVCGLCAIHLAYTAVMVGGSIFLRQESVASGEWIIARGLTPAQVGPAIAGVLQAAAVLALMLFVLSIFLTVRKSAWWYSVACHSMLLSCIFLFVKGGLSALDSLKQFQLNLSLQLRFYIVAILVCASIIWLFTVHISHKPKSRNCF